MGWEGHGSECTSCTDVAKSACPLLKLIRFNLRDLRAEGPGSGSAPEGAFSASFPASRHPPSTPLPPDLAKAVPAKWIVLPNGDDVAEILEDDCGDLDRVGQRNQAASAIAEFNLDF